MRYNAAAGTGGGRRQFLRDCTGVGAAAAAVLAGAPLLAGCGIRPTGQAAPTAQQPVETVAFQVNWQQSWNQSAQRMVQDYTDSAFNSKHKGIRAVPQSWGNASGILTEVLAGSSQAPAVVSSCCGDFAVAQPMLAPLDPLLRRDNLSTSLWSAGQLLTYQMPSGLYGVPAYTACQPLIYRQDIFDQLGMQYPDPAWTYKDAESIWRQLVGTQGGKHRYATTFQWYPNNFDGSVFLLKGFGGEEMDASKTVCLFDQPGSINAAKWIYPLIWDKVMINRGGLGMSGAQGLAHNHAVMYQSAGNMLFEAVEVLGNSFKWDVLPMPKWPVRRATNVQVDYYGINAHFKNQELAWELFKFVAATQETNRFLIKATLSFPNLISMWDEWEVLVRAAAPLTRNKQLKWWRIAAQQGYGYGHEFFANEPNVALGLMSPTLQKMWNHQLDPALGYPLIAKQVTAFEKNAASTLQKQAKVQAAISKHYPTANGHDFAVVQPGL